MMNQSKQQNVTLVQQLCKEGWIEEAIEAVLVLQPQEQAFKAAVLISVLGGEHDLDQAFHIYSALQQPDVVVISMLIGACWQCSEPGQEMGCLLDDMGQLGIAFDKMSFRVMAAACGKSGN